MSPVVVKDHSVVFSDGQQPPAQRLGEGERRQGQEHRLIQQGWGRAALTS